MEVREKERLNCLFTALYLISQTTKIRRENWRHSRKPHITEIAVVYPCTYLLQAKKYRSRPEQTASPPIYCFCSRNTCTKAVSSLEITFREGNSSGIKGKVYNKGLARKDNNGEKNRRDTTTGGQFPPVNSSREIPGSQIILCLSTLEEQQRLNLFWPSHQKTFLASWQTPASICVLYYSVLYVGYQ